MFDQLVVIGDLLLTSLSRFVPTRNKKRAIGKLLGSVYVDLTTLLENGDRLLRLFRRHNNGRPIRIDELKTLLYDQHALIRRLSSILRKKDMRTILSIHAPQINPLMFLISDKGGRIIFYLDQINRSETITPRRADIEWLRYRARIECPNNESLNRARKHLREIKSLTERLRIYVVEHFEVSEII